MNIEKTNQEKTPEVNIITHDDDRSLTRKILFAEEAGDMETANELRELRDRARNEAQKKIEEADKFAKEGASQIQRNQGDIEDRSTARMN